MSIIKPLDLSDAGKCNLLFCRYKPFQTISVYFKLQLRRATNITKNQFLWCLLASQGLLGLFPWSGACSTFYRLEGRMHRPKHTRNRKQRPCDQCRRLRTKCEFRHSETCLRCSSKGQVCAFQLGPAERKETRKKTFANGSVTDTVTSPIQQQSLATSFDASWGKLAERFCKNSPVVILTDTPIRPSG